MKKILGVLAVSLLMGACGNTADDKEEKVEDSTEQTEVVEEVKADEESPSEESEVVEESPELLVIGDSATIDDITLTVNSVSFTDERNSYADTTPERVIAIEYTLENGQEEDYPFGMDMDLYVDGKKADTYPLGTDFGSVSAGRAVDSVAYFGVDGEEIELEWQPMFGMEDKAVWDLTE